VLDAVVQHPAELVGGHSQRGEQVRAAHIADEQRVAGEHAVRHGVGGVLVEQDADRLRCVARRLEDLQHDVAELDALAVGQLADRVLGLGTAPVADPGTRTGGQFEVTGDEVGVEVGVDHPLDLQPMRTGVGDVLEHVTAGVHDHGAAARLVADQVRRVGQAVQVVLREDHFNPPECGSLARLFYTPRGIKR
jgi:hypothetical protein